MLMKSLLILGVMTALSNVAIANYQGPTSLVSKVNQLSTMSEEKKVILEGWITNKLGAEHYEFTDKTGVIVVEIEQKNLPFDFKNNKMISFSERDTVILRGQLNHEGDNRSIVEVQDIKVM